MSGTGKAYAITPGTAEGPVLVLSEGLSFWGGVDPATGRIIDVHHPQCGAELAGAIVVMPTTRGSCSGSGVVLELVLAGRGPAALLFTEGEDVATLGAMVASAMFGRDLPVLRLSPDAAVRLGKAATIRITRDAILADADSMALDPAPAPHLELSAEEQAMLDGSRGKATQQAMQVLVAAARQQGATALTTVSRAHIDGCIYASPANLTFAETMEALGAVVSVPTTTNAISVDRRNWQQQGVEPGFGTSASRLADSYVRMGCQPTFTCAPYLLDEHPASGDHIGWSESNAVIYANSVLGARTAKHPDFLDLCIAITGRAPRAGVYLPENRRARRIIDVELPPGADAAAWPLVGYLVGRAAPDVIPLIRNVAAAEPTPDDLKALCAAFGTTSAAPMLHIEGVTPEAAGAATPDATRATLTRSDLCDGWRRLNQGPAEIDLVAIGSPHASLRECRALADALDGRSRHRDVAAMVTAGRAIIAQAEADGTLARLRACGVAVIPDLCWCTITRPVFPQTARSVMTTSGKYAHYGPGLSGCSVRLGTLADCVDALTTGTAPARLPAWLRG